MVNALIVVKNGHCIFVYNGINVFINIKLTQNLISSMSILCYPLMLCTTIGCTVPCLVHTSIV